jgi:hypothetical protein
MSTAPATAGKNRNWIVFFLMLAFLAGLGIVVPLWYNLSLQLKAPELEAARQLWQAAGPADYDLEYMSKIDKDEGVEYRVAVRDHRAEFLATRKGDVLELSQDLHDALGMVVGCPVANCAPKVVPADDLSRRESIDAFFSLLESKMRDDVAVGGRNYATATFDSNLGYPLRYIHRVRGSQQRIELNVHLLPANSPYDPR